MTRTIRCASFWDALVLRRMLEEEDVQVRVPDERVALSMVASGALDAIKAGVAHLSQKFPRSGPVLIEGEDGSQEMAAGLLPAPGGRIAEQSRIAGQSRETGPAERQASRPRCVAVNAKGGRCKLTAQPGNAMCAIHARRTHT